MRFSNIITLLALHAIGVYASPTSDAATECGDLGVMKYDEANLPEGVHPDAMRKCLNHPAGNTKQTLDRRFCWFGEDKGCKDNYCWRSCGVEGSGQWCWTAAEGGYGAWVGCSSPNDCSYDDGCGIGLDCDDCGCSC